MASRGSTQSEHDAVIYALKALYEHHGKHVWVNPGSEKNYAWCGCYIDVIVVENIPAPSVAWVIEVETEDSVTDEEARNQWCDYDQAYQQRWHLAVPVKSEAKARGLIQKYRIEHCTLATWVLDSKGVYTFNGLPQASGRVQSST